MPDLSHGQVGTREQSFTNLLPLKENRFAAADLKTLADAMKAEHDTVKDGADPEENLWVPSGYTYFGQFIDHDMTFDSTSSLNPDDDAGRTKTRVPTNLRTPRFDLDCLYGDGPDAQPFMYGPDGATLLDGASTNGQAWDLLRVNGRAVIGDKRNDENSIVCQIQLGFLKFHNAVVAALLKVDDTEWNVPRNLFASARNEVIWTYQRLIVEDFLPRIVADEVLSDLKNKTPAERVRAFVLYTEDLRTNLPREFVGAAYRYGHSGVRTGYRLNPHKRRSIFPGSPPDKADDESLVGFGPLPQNHVIDDWGRFLPTTGPGADVEMGGRVAAQDSDEVQPGIPTILQYAYKLDPTIVDPIGLLPVGVSGNETINEARAAIHTPGFPPGDGRVSLALLNLLRANRYGIATGQEVAKALRDRGKNVATLTDDELVIRTPAANAPDGSTNFKWVRISEFVPGLRDNTPLWFYVLAESQAPLMARVPKNTDGTFSENELLNGPGAQTQLGWVGGRIVAEVLYGLLDSDDNSFLRAEAARNWKPRIGQTDTFTLRSLLDFSKTL